MPTVHHPLENPSNVPPSGSASRDGGVDPEEEKPHEVAAEPPRPRRRGFAAMDRDRVRQIASKGGRAAHAAGTAHQFSSEEARIAGRKGGMAPHIRRGGARRRQPAAETPPPAPSAAEERGHGEGR
jgi:general stress protein YciG